MNINKNLRDKIINVFRSAKGEEYWLTVDEVVRLTAISVHEVIKIMTESGDFVRSSYRTKNGEPLYTTRELFREKAPFMDKIIGAFKNRID
jgi:hypothetical protein